MALLNNAKATVRIDFGFGDTVSPEQARMPTLIDDLPAPFLLVYPMVSVIAEKFQAMVHLGLSNTRMKDFYDIWALSESFEHRWCRTAGGGSQLLQSPRHSMD